MTIIIEMGYAVDVSLPVSGLFILGTGRLSFLVPRCFQWVKGLSETSAK